MDMDHAGGIDQDSQTDWFKQAQVFVGMGEKSLIDGSTPRSFFFLNPIEISRKCNYLDDEDTVQVGTVTVRALATPGHTPGHMAYMIDDEILCSGDALVLNDGNVEPFYRTWNMNHEQVEQSIRKIAALENISVLCTAHTKYSRDFESAIRQWRG